MLIILLAHLSLITTALSLFVSPAPTPAPIANTQDVTKRCNDGECTYGGTAQTLTANTVTTTILSTTSVPCYITTYVTDSTTTTSTVYSTDIITSTVTQKGTVTVIQYQPTPILKSSTYKSVIEITETGTTFWQETQGSAYVKTITGDTQTIGGDTSGGKDYGGASLGTTVLISTAAATGPGSAWTHEAAEAAGVTTIKANGGVVNTATANGGWANTVGTGTNGAAVNANGVAVHWNGAWTKDDISSFLVILGAVGAVLVFEVCHYLG